MQFKADNSREKEMIMEGMFLFGGGGGSCWAGATEGRVIRKTLTIWGGSNLFRLQPGEGQSKLVGTIFLKNHNTPGYRFYG